MFGLARLNPKQVTLKDLCSSAQLQVCIQIDEIYKKRPRVLFAVVLFGSFPLPSPVS